MYDVQQARERNGDAAEDRADHVDEIVDCARLGYGEGDPLIGDSYDEYPEQPADLARPDARPFVTELLSHDLVTSVRDAVEETTGGTADRLIVRDWRQAFERAAELFDVEIEGDDEPNESEDESRLSELVADYPDDMVTPSNPLVVLELYAEYGLSTEEIAELFSEDSDKNIKRGQVRGVLRNAGLVEGKRMEGGRTAEDVLVNLPDESNVNANAVAADPNVTVESDDETED